MDGVPGLRALPPPTERGPTPVHDREARPPRDGARRDRTTSDSEENRENKEASRDAAQVELTSAASDALPLDATVLADPPPNEEDTPPPVGRRIDLRA
jgi:hypothetical protein